MEKILIVTDQKLLFGEYAFLIEKYASSTSVSMVSCYCDVLSLLKREHYDLVIFDMNVADFNSLELFFMLSGKSKATRVLMVNVEPEDEIIFEMHRLGVTGLLSTKADENEFGKAIVGMLEEGKYFSPVLAEKVFFYGLNTADLSKHKAMTAREMQVMLMLGNGRSIKEIAEHIYLSEKTIRTYKSRVYKKMEFRNDSQLVEYLLSHSFL